MPDLCFRTAIIMCSGRELSWRGICGRKNLLIFQKDILKNPKLKKNLGGGVYLLKLFFLFVFRVEASADARSQPCFCDCENLLSL